MSSTVSPSLLSLLINDAAIIGSPIISFSPVSEILSPRPIRRVSFDAIVRLAADFESAVVTNAIVSLITNTTTTTNWELLSGSTPEEGGERGGSFGVVGGERKGKGVGVIGGERRFRK